MQNVRGAQQEDDEAGLQQVGAVKQQRTLTFHARAGNPPHNSRGLSFWRGLSGFGLWLPPTLSNERGGFDGH